MTNKGAGMGIGYCTDCVIENNKILPFNSGGAWSGLFLGVSMGNPIRVSFTGNVVQGSGNPGDLRALTSYADFAGTNGMKISGNTFSKKTMLGSNPPVFLKGYDNFVFENNKILEIGGDVHAALKLGVECVDGVIAKNGLIKGNTFSFTGTEPTFAIIGTKTENLVLEGNSHTNVNLWECSK